MLWRGCEMRSVPARVSRTLRRKLGKERILTVRGMGYALHA